MARSTAAPPAERSRRRASRWDYRWWSLRRPSTSSGKRRSGGCSEVVACPASVGACLYAACRRYSIPRTLGEVAQAVGTRRSDVGRTFKVVQRGAGLPIPGVGTKAFLTRYAQELALSPRVRSTVEAMLDQAREDPELSGLSPHGLVAALIYIAAEQNGEHRSRAQVARVSTVTEVTLRSTSRLVEKVWGRARVARGEP